MTPTAIPAARPRPAPTYVLGFVPGSFVRHAHASIDERALCGAASVPQGARLTLPWLRPTCSVCRDCVTP